MANNADGSIIIDVDLDEKDAQKELTKLTRNIEKTKSKLKEQTNKRSGIKAELEAAKDEALKTESVVRRLKAELAKEQKLTDMNASSPMSVSPQEYLESLERQQNISAQLKEQEKLLARQDAAAEKLGKEYEDVVDAIKKTTGELENAETRAGRLAQQVTKVGKSSNAMGKATSKAAKQMDVFGKRVASVVRSALIFTVITQILAKFREWVARVVKTSEEASAAMAKFKGALLTMVQPLVDVIIPAFTALVNVATKCVMALAQFFSWLGGTSVKANAEAAESLHKEAEALDGVGSAAEDAKKQLASFDEINKLSDTSGGGSDTIAPDFDFGEADSFGDKFFGIFRKLEPIVTRIKQLFKDLLDFDFSPLGEGLSKMLNGLLDGDFAMFADGLEQVLDTVIRYVLHVAASLLEFIRDMGLMFVDWFKDIGNSFLDWLNDITGGKLSNTIEAIRVLFNNLIEDVKLIFDGFVDFLVGVFTGDWEMAWQGLKKIFKGVFEGIADIALSVVNSIIGFIKDLIGWVRDAIAALRELDASPNTGGSGGIGGWGSYATITGRSVPALAQGAVIPANREFLAILGDQKSGTNIETPLDTMLQAFRQALSEMGGGNNVPVKLYLDGKLIAETVSRYQRNAERAGG